MTQKAPVWTEQTRKLSELRPYERNPRRISKEAYERLKKSITDLGFHQRVLCQPDGKVIGGHQRLRVLAEMGVKEVKCLVPDRPLTEPEYRRLLIQDNLAFGEWDMEILANTFEMAELVEFGMPETLLGDLVMPEQLEEETEPLPEAPENPVTVIGDVWLLGNHRIMCGDSTDVNQVEKLTKKTLIDVCYTDPPYGVNVVKQNKVGADFGVAKKGRYHSIIGDDTTETAIKSFGVCNALKIKNLIFWGGNYYANNLPASNSWLVWDKRCDTGIENTFADCELAWTNLSSPTRIYRQLWNGMIREGEKEKRIHPTQKPIELAVWCLSKVKGAETVLDLFLGSGSTLIACEKNGYICYGMELDPIYCDVIIKRWQNYTGKQAIREADGRPFNECKPARIVGV